MRIPILKWILTRPRPDPVSFFHLAGGSRSQDCRNYQHPGRGLCGLGTLDRMIKAFSYLSRNEDFQNILIFRLYTEDDPTAELNIHRNLGIIRELLS